MKTIAQELYEKGYAEGFAEGFAEGYREGFLDVLRLRFGSLSEPVLARVEAADRVTIDRWIERFFSASSADELVAGP